MQYVSFMVGVRMGFNVKSALWMNEYWRRHTDKCIAHHTKELGLIYMTLQWPPQRSEDDAMVAEDGGPLGCVCMVTVDISAPDHSGNVSHPGPVQSVVCRTLV